MGGFIKVDAERTETMALNTKVNKYVFDDFKVYCKELGYPMNVVIETFMRQFANGKFRIDSDDINKFNKKNNDDKKATINTTFNKEIYLDFKSYCKANGYFVNSAITAFMEKFVSREYVMEFIKLEM